MKQIAQYQDGRLELQEVPCPVPPPGGGLVRTTHSVISIGTEKMKVEQAKMNLLQKAKARPDQVREVIDTARNIGWKSAYEKVRNRLSSPTPLGYSAAGIVEAVDEGNSRFRVGDRVEVEGTLNGSTVEADSVHMLGSGGDDDLADSIVPAVGQFADGIDEIGSRGLFGSEFGQPEAI